MGTTHSINISDLETNKKYYLNENNLIENRNLAKEYDIKNIRGQYSYRNLNIFKLDNVNKYSYEEFNKKNYYLEKILIYHTEANKHLKIKNIEINTEIINTSDFFIYENGRKITDNKLQSN